MQSIPDQASGQQSYALRVGSAHDLVQLPSENDSLRHHRRAFRNRDSNNVVGGSPLVRDMPVNVVDSRRELKPAAALR